MAYSFVWPASLPQRPLARGYTESRGALILRTPMDMGAPKMRRRAARPEPITATYLMTTAQLATLETFVFTTLGCVKRFGWPKPPTEALVEVRLVSGEDGQLYTVAAVSAALWEVTVSVEVMP